VREIQALNEQGVKVFNLQVDDSNQIEDLAAQSTRELELLDKKFSKKKKKKKRLTDGNAPRVNQGQGPRPEGSTPKSADQSTSMAAPAQVRPAEGNQSPRQGDKRRKNKNRPRPNANQGPAVGPSSGIPKVDSPAPKPGEKPQEGPRKFPPRINQGPSGKPDND
jgi:hypothetical protein